MFAKLERIGVFLLLLWFNDSIKKYYRSYGCISVNRLNSDFIFFVCQFVISFLFLKSLGEQLCWRANSL